MDCRRDVPEAVLFDILLLLPVVSLLRFKTVCKSWCSIIKSSSFIRQQLGRNSEKQNLIVQDDGGQVFILSGRKHDVCVNLDLKGVDPEFLIIGSCNGIICLLYEYSSSYWCLSLWNPATKQVRKLPESSYFSPRKAWSSNGFALGFDIKTNDYKIVSISLDKLYEEKMLIDSLVQVYNMRTDSWRTIHQGGDFPIRHIDLFCDAACKNELCLFIGYSAIGGSVVILYFDLTEETYGTMPLPDDCKSDTDYILTFVKDKITYMECNKTSHCCYYEIWRMEEFGRKESWNKLYKLKVPILVERMAVQLYLSMDGDFIIGTEGDQDIYEMYVYYCTTAKVEKKLDVLNACIMKNYIESMVPVKVRDGSS